jgi:hypothetical protein
MRRKDLLLWSVSVAAAAAGAALVLRYNPIGVLRACPLRALTGVPCPTCGGTESLTDMLRGRIWASFLANPMVATVSLAIAASGVSSLFLIPWAPRIRLPRWPSGLLLPSVVLLLILANWLYLFLRTR